MRVDAHASERHYLDHVAPIWGALDPEIRGTFYVSHRLEEYARRHGIVPVRGRPTGPRRLTVVASYQDLRSAGSRPCVLLNHGTGQRYDGDPRSAHNPAYSGGRDRGKVVLYLCPSTADADACREAQPDVPAVTIGCPKLDRYQGKREKRADNIGNNLPTVAIAFHWNCRVCPEADWALPAYRETFPDLATAEGFNVIGHGHPRAWRRLEALYSAAGIEAVRDLDEVFARADLFVADNTSSMYEAASIGINVVALNAPWYRRDVHHGLRFWDYVPGPQVDSPEELIPTIERVLADRSDAELLRVRAARRTYTHRDGDSAMRAARAIQEVLETLTVEEGSGMANPKAPRVRRNNGNVEPIFPEARLRRLGASDAVLSVARTRWLEYDKEDRFEAANEMAVMTDSELRAAIQDDQKEIDAMVGVPEGSK